MRLLRLDDTTVSGIARRLGVNWHTCPNAVSKHTETSIDIKKRASGVKAIGADEHIWRPSRISSADKAVTVMVDLTRGPDRRLAATRCRVQQATLGRRGHKEDPLYRVRRTLLTGAPHLTDRQRARLDKWLPLGDPNSEVEVPWLSAAGTARSAQSSRGLGLAQTRQARGGNGSRQRGLPS